VHGLPLVTGATGFAGGHLVDRLIAGGRSVNALAHAGGHTGTERAGVRWFTADLLDRGAVRDVIEHTRPSVVYHCAGFADVHDASRAPGRALRLNVLGTHFLLESCRDLGLACRVVVTGSALIYRQRAEAISEDDEIAPNNAYGVSKLAQEMTAMASGLAVVMARPFNHAGPRQTPAFATSAFAQQIVRIERGLAEPVLRVGNLDARAERGVPLRPYNVCSGRAYRMRDLLDLLLSLARVRVRIDVDPARLRPSDTPLVLGSHARLTAETGWRPEIPIERTMADLLDYWRAHEAPR